MEDRFRIEIKNHSGIQKWAIEVADFLRSLQPQMTRMIHSSLSMHVANTAAGYLDSFELDLRTSFDNIHAYVAEYLS